jgi:hypothetical protein
MESRSSLSEKSLVIMEQLKAKQLTFCLDKEAPQGTGNRSNMGEK